MKATKVILTRKQKRDLSKLELVIEKLQKVNGGSSGGVSFRGYMDRKDFLDGLTELAITSAIENKEEELVPFMKKMRPEIIANEDAFADKFYGLVGCICNLLSDYDSLNQIPESLMELEAFVSALSQHVYSYSANRDTKASRFVSLLKKNCEKAVPFYTTVAIEQNILDTFNTKLKRTNALLRVDNDAAVEYLTYLPPFYKHLIARLSEGKESGIKANVLLHMFAEEDSKKYSEIVNSFEVEPEKKIEPIKKTAYELPEPSVKEKVYSSLSGLMSLAGNNSIKADNLKKRVSYLLSDISNLVSENDLLEFKQQFADSHFLRNMKRENTRLSEVGVYALFDILEHNNFKKGKIPTAKDIDSGYYLALKETKYE